MKDQTNIDRLQSKLALARAERDAWKRKSAHHFEMASILVAAIEAELKRVIEGQSSQK